MASAPWPPSSLSSADAIAESDNLAAVIRVCAMDDESESLAAEMDHEPTGIKRGRTSVETATIDKRSDEERPNLPKRMRNGGDGSQVETTSPDGGLRQREDGRDAGPKVTRQRLLFPDDCKLSFQQKVLWTMKIGREHRSFQPLLKEGRNRPYITVGSEEAVKHLTEKGYEGVMLKLPPQEQEQTNKIIIFRYPVWLEEEYLLDDPRVVWARRNKVRGEARSQVIALWKGEIPDTLFVTGIGRRPVRRYIEEQPMCLRCSRWGHQAWSCMMDERCRFCGGNHISTRCGEKIKANKRVLPRCCNCGGPHNAKSSDCPKRPGLRSRGLDYDSSRGVVGVGGVAHLLPAPPHPCPAPPSAGEAPHLYPGMDQIQLYLYFNCI